MNRKSLVLLGLALVLGLATTFQAGAVSSSGYVVYSVQASFKGTQRTFIVNESVSPSFRQSQSVLSLVVKSASTNLTISHLINSSSTVFPYLPALTTNESFTYNNDSYSVAGRMKQNGSSQVTFEGRAYTLEDYSFYANFTRGASSRNIHGGFSVFSSGLLYSIAVHSNGTLFAATLTSTSLPLSATTTTTNLQAVSAGVGVSVAAGAVALSLGVRAARHKNGQGQTAKKPDHWVD